MSANKVSKAPHVKRGFDRTHDNALESLTRSFVQCSKHGVRGFPNCNHENATVGMQSVKIFANAQHIFIAGHVLLKRATDSRFTQSMLKNVECNLFHSSVSLIHVSTVCRISFSRPSKK